MKSTTVFEIEVEAPRNLLHLRYAGSVTAADMKAGIQRTEGLLAQMRKGFTVVADLTGLEAMALDCGPHLSRMMELCKVQGVGRVIRVIPDPSKDIGLNILSLIHYRGKVQVITCETMAEAERALR
ncbi:MAG TPA: hypothetical protein VG838_11405 [Opitutaceae bacterium]|nr:hypothetical protein [Opitutaceae bacterium]